MRPSRCLACGLTTNKNFAIVIATGVAFFLIFTAFGTASQANESVLEGARAESNGTFTGSGYISLAILYGAFAIFNWFAPVIVIWLGAKHAMFIGAATYTIFCASFFMPMTWSLYLFSALNGCGAAVLWTAQGVFITQCSRSTNITRHFSIFWMMLQSSGIVGSMYTYFQLTDVKSIDEPVRVNMYTVFTIVSGLGCVVLLLLPQPLPAPPQRRSNSTGSGMALNEAEARCSPTPFVREPNAQQEPPTEPISPNGSTRGSRSSGSLLIPPRPSLLFVLRRSAVLCRSGFMFSILLASAYTGLNLTFYSGVYGTCLSRMLTFGAAAKSYIGLSGIFIGIGEVLGSQFTLMSRFLRPGGVILFGYVTGTAGLFLAYLMLPPEAPLTETWSVSFVEPSVYLAMFIAVLLGLTDSLWNTQISSLIGRAYPSSTDDTAVAFALFKCVQSLTAAASFFYSPSVLLHWQLLTTAIVATVGVFGFFCAEWTYEKQANLVIPVV